jgi:hypothetical protein
MPASICRPLVYEDDLESSNGHAEMRSKVQDVAAAYMQSSSASGRFTDTKPSDIGWSTSD